MPAKETKQRSAVADQVIQNRLGRLASEEHVLSVLEELSLRAGNRLRERGGDDSFKVGLYAGYVQAISLLLDCSYEQAKRLVDEGWL